MNQKICCGNFYILGQIIEASNPPENIHTYVSKEKEVKMIRLKYNSSTGEFLGLHETVES